MTHVLPRNGPINVPITLGVDFFESGTLFTPFSVGPVRIYDQAIGGTLLATLTPDAYGVGEYCYTWNALATSSSLTPGIYYDEISWIAQEGMSTKTQRYSFELTTATTPTDPVDPTPTDPVSQEVGCRSRPSWEFHIGLRLVEDVGNGMGMRLSWGKALPSGYSKVVHYNIYYSDTRFGVFDGWPQAMTTEQQVIINIAPGNLHYFAVRATEFLPTEFDITDLTQIGTNLYQYPDTITLLNDIDAYGSTLNVASTGGYPEKGFLLLETEVLQYSLKDETGFFVEDDERGAITTPIDEHYIGTDIQLWHGVEEHNTIIFEETAAWHQDYGTPRNTEEIGEPNVASDGYREAAADNLTTDLTASDQSTEDFPSYDYTGYHKPSLQATFNGECTQSYVGGEFDGGRGFFFQDRNLARLDAMLQVTGEPLVLLKRKWTGRRCRCMGLRREHPRTRCQYCYSVGFDGGYDRYVNTRPISESSANTQGFILARIHPYTDDLELDASQSLRQPVEQTAWTINVPTLKDRDFIIRYNEDGSEEFRYEVLDVNRNKLFFGKTGKQEFRIKRHDKTDIIYAFETEVL